MNPADQPGKSTSTTISVPNKSKSATNTNHRVSSGPNVTSSSVVQTGESQPDNECPALVLKENIEPRHAPHSRELGVSVSSQETYGSTRGWINKWLSRNHSPYLTFPNQSYPKSLEKLSMNQSRMIPFPVCVGLCQVLCQQCLAKV